jgi:hypothetical protein
VPLERFAHVVRDSNRVPPGVGLAPKDVDNPFVG